MDTLEVENFEQVESWIQKWKMDSENIDHCKRTCHRAWPYSAVKEKSSALRSKLLSNPYALQKKCSSIIQMDTCVGEPDDTHNSMQGVGSWWEYICKCSCLILWILHRPQTDRRETPTVVRYSSAHEKMNQLLHLLRLWQSVHPQELVEQVK